MTHREMKKAKKTNADYNKHVEPIRIDNDDIEKHDPHGTIAGKR
jgi:hypothetical protein